MKYISGSNAKRKKKTKVNIRQPRPISQRNPQRVVVVQTRNVKTFKRDALMVIIALIVVVKFLSVEMDVQYTTYNIAKVKEEIAELKDANAMTENRMNASTASLTTIKEGAEELGMTQTTKDQIIYYDSTVGRSDTITIEGDMNYQENTKWKAFLNELEYSFKQIYNN